MKFSPCWKNTVPITGNPGDQVQVNLFRYFNHNHDADWFGKDADTTDFPYAKNIHQNEMGGFF
jgi:hypothetical protein